MFTATVLRKSSPSVRLSALWQERGRPHALGSPGSRRPHVGDARFPSITRSQDREAAARGCGPGAATQPSRRGHRGDALPVGPPAPPGRALCSPGSYGRGKKPSGVGSRRASVGRGCQARGHSRCRSATARPRAGRLGPGEKRARGRVAGGGARGSPPPSRCGPRLAAFLLAHLLPATRPVFSLLLVPAADLRAEERAREETRAPV